MSQTRVIAVAVSFLALLLSGCGSSSSPLPPSPVVTDSFRSDANKNVAIKTEALNREFMLQGNLVTLTTAQEFGGLKSRIVLFQKQGNKLLMLESQKGHTVTPDMPFALILAEFSIVREEDGWFYFDFNQGMSRLFTTTDMYVTDYDGEDYQPATQSVPVNISFLSSVDTSSQNRLSIRQSAQLQKADGTTPSVEVRYYLTPYLPDQSFSPTESPGFTHAGYFEVAPQINSGIGDTTVLASKWNIGKKPITYYLSANTPSAYREAVKNGVLYWNMALGETAFAVADAPVGVTAPDMNYNIIQWLDFDKAGYAYADMQSDPRTGEILHAQVFMPSIFAVGGKEDAWQLLHRLSSSPDAAAQSLISLRNLNAPGFCKLDMRNQIEKGVMALLAENASDAAILKASQAYVQYVVTHEVGHTLGLRHNFAGSLTSDYGTHDRYQLYANFIHNGDYIKVTPASSVMDYLDPVDDTVAMNVTTMEQKALAHDTGAMRFLYKNEPLDAAIPFCTDSDEGIMLDCKVFDYGKSPIEYASRDLQRGLSSDLPMKLYLKLVLDVLDGKSFATLLKPDVTVWSTELLNSKKLMINAFTQEGLYARTMKRLYPDKLLGNIDKAALRRSVIPEVRADLDSWFLTNPYGMKSVQDLFTPVDPAWKPLWITRFNQIVDDPAFYSITAPNGTRLTFTENQRSQLKAMAAVFFAELIPALAKKDVELMSTSNLIDIVDGTAGSGFVAAMNATSSNYLMAVTGETLSATVNGVPLSLPVFRYDWELRLAASSLLSNRAVPGALWWGIMESDSNKTTLSTFLDNVVSGFPSAILGSSTSEGAFLSQNVADGFAKSGFASYQWYLENKKLL